MRVQPDVKTAGATPCCLPKLHIHMRLLQSSFARASRVCAHARCQPALLTGTIKHLLIMQMHQIAVGSSPLACGTAAAAQLLHNSDCSLPNRSASSSTTPECGDRAKELSACTAHNKRSTALACCVASCTTCRCSILTNSSGSSLRPAAHESRGHGQAEAGADLRGGRCSDAGSP